MRLKIGELAKRSGLTIRTLHHYDNIGLLKPSARSDAGYRLYSQGDVVRLQQIQALRSLGVSLAEVGAMVNRRDVSVAAIIEEQLSLLDKQIDRSLRLRDRLQRLQDLCAAGGEPTLADWLDTLAVMSMYDRYFSPEELHGLPFYIGSDTAAAIWAELVQEANTLLRQETKPSSEPAADLARRWMAQLQQDTSADPSLFSRLEAMHATEPEMQARTGVSLELSDFILRAFAETRLAIYRRYLSDDEFLFMQKHYLDSMRQWPALMAELRQARDQGLAANSETVQRLALRWIDLFRSYAGDNPETQRKIHTANQSEPALMEGTWLDQELIAYLTRAVASVTTTR
ncbi:MerR family transcriptional regulator [Stutzerimonas urumqiensis]